MPACGPPSSLSPQQLGPGEHGESRPVPDRVPNEGLVAEGQQGAAADVGDDGGTERGELRHAHGLGEAPYLEVARVDPEDGAGVLADGRLVVREPGAVRGADLAQFGAGEGEHLGYAEAAPDLDELPPGDDHLGLPPAPGRDSGERQQRRARAVVDDERVPGAGQIPQERRGPVVARAPLPGRQVVLQVRVAGGGLYGGGYGVLREDGAAKVCVEDDAGRVDDPAQPPVGEGPRGQRDDALLRGFGLLVGGDPAPQVVQDGPDGGGRGGAAVPPGERGPGGVPQHRVHGREAPEPLPLPRLKHTVPSITRPVGAGFGCKTLC